MAPQVELFFVHFLEELKTTKRHFEINWPLKTNIKILEHCTVEETYMVLCKNHVHAVGQALGYTALGYGVSISGYKISITLSLKA